MNTTFKTLSLILILLSSCASKKDLNEPIEIIYKTQSRAGFEIISFKENSITKKSNRSSKTIDLSKKQIKSIHEAVSKINLATIAKLKAPSNNSFHDGAKATTITIKKENNSYRSSRFDHNNPPIELKELVDLINSFK